MPAERHLRLVHAGPAQGNPLLVAFATSDLKAVDEHFGAASHFAIYTVDETGSRFSEAIAFGAANKDGNEDKLEPRLKAVTHCSLVYCRAIGGSAVRRLIAQGVRPVRVDNGRSIQELLDTIEPPPPGGARAPSNAKDPNRFRTMLNDSWRDE